MSALHTLTLDADEITLNPVPTPGDSVALSLRAMDETGTPVDLSQAALRGLMSALMVS